MALRTLRLGTRGSPLARAQAGMIAAAIERAHPGLAVPLVLIRTTGDQLSQGPLAPAGGKGLFVKEIEEALAAGSVDFAVHSLKDVPAALAPGMVLGAIPTRADARDVLVGAGAGGLAGLRPGARVGTASVRRRAQLLAHRRDLDIVFLRGNVDTRLRKWRDGEVDALILAAAGLVRLGVDEPDAQPLSPDDLLPAVGQGALALECRADDDDTRALLGAVHDDVTATAIAAERGFLVAIGGDCNTPLAAYARVDGGAVVLRVQVSDVDGLERIEDADQAPCADAAALGARLADRLLARGAGRLLGR
ncbi:MAG TPA: hydroxymethylbilane synthase [Candidatus Binatia bacterium]|nr:hydroxymethylbilane synthase [Candidatus Binatia bacterium]